MFPLHVIDVKLIFDLYVDISILQTGVKSQERF